MALKVRDLMKIRIEIDDNLTENEIVIKCKALDNDVMKVQKYVLELSSAVSKMTFFKDEREYYLSLSEVMFFETDEAFVYAHTNHDAYRVKYRLYELEEILPHDFIRVSKSTIVNVASIFSIDRNLTSSSLIQFYNSHKKVFVSRLYYKNLRQRLDGRRNNERK